MLAENQEGKKLSKIKLFIIDNDDINAFALPNCIFIERAFLYRYQNNDDIIKAVLSHELSHILRKDCYLKSLFYVNIYVGIISLTVIQIGVVFIAFFVVALVLGIIFGSELSELVSTVLGKLLSWIFNLIKNILYYVNLFIAKWVFRFQEKMQMNMR